MLEAEMRFMLEKAITDKKTFRELYRKGVLSYGKEQQFNGKIAIVNNRAVIAFLQDSNDENNAIATMNFNENEVEIFKLLGKNWSHYQFGSKEDDAYTYGGVYSARANNYDRDRIAREINRICGFCDKTSKRESIIKALGEKKLSKKQVYSLLVDTLDKLTRTSELYEKAEVCPKVKVPPLSNSATKHSPTPKINKTPEL